MGRGGERRGGDDDLVSNPRSKSVREWVAGRKAEREGGRGKKLRHQTAEQLLLQPSPC